MKLNAHQKDTLDRFVLGTIKLAKRRAGQLEELARGERLLDGLQYVDQMRAIDQCLQRLKKRGAITFNRDYSAWVLVR